MRLRKMLRSNSLNQLQFKRDWKDAGLSLSLSNREIKEYLKGLRSDTLQSVQKTSDVSVEESE